jgi:hypothetical protein
VYWYGNSENMGSAYSLLKSKDLIEFEEGRKSWDHKLKKLRKKEESGKKLSKKEASMLGVCEEMEKDLKKLPSERHGYVRSDFWEDYEWPSEGEMPGEEDVDDEEYQLTSQKKRKKKGEKRKKIKRDKDEPELNRAATDANDEARVTKRAKTKFSKKTKEHENSDFTSKEPRPNKKAKAADAIESTSKEPRPKKKAKSADAIEAMSTMKTVEDPLENETDPTDANEPAPPAGEAESAKLSAYEEFLAIGDVSSPDEADDDFEGESIKSGDDDADPDYDAGSKHKTKKLKLKKTQDPPKERVKKNARQAKVKIEKRPKGEKKTASMEALKNSEQRRFELCEKKFLKLIRQWRKAVSNEDADQIRRIYGQLLEEMDNFTAPFIEVYEMPLLMKQSKAILNDDKRREVMAAFKEAYARKLEQVPAGFRAVKESEKGVAGKEVDPVAELTHEKSMATRQVPSTNATTATDTPRPTDADDELTSEERNALHDELSVKIPRSTLNEQTEPSGEVPSSKMTPEVESQNENERRKEKEAREPSTQKVTPVKPDRKKKFSLGTLMRPTSSSQSSGQSSAANPSSSIRRESSSGSLSKVNRDGKTPMWTEVPATKDRPAFGSRALALDFLDQAVAFIPEGKKTNHDAIVRNLELAVFEWATSEGASGSNRLGATKEPNGRSVTAKKNENGNATVKKDKQGSNGCDEENVRSDGRQEEDPDAPWVDEYWGKIHALAAGISGNETKDGTLATLIAEGHFETAEKVVGLSDDELWKSFQSEPLQRLC